MNTFKVFAILVLTLGLSLPATTEAAKNNGANPIPAVGQSCTVDRTIEARSVNNRKRGKAFAVQKGSSLEVVRVLKKWIQFKTESQSGYVWKKKFRRFCEPIASAKTEAPAKEEAKAEAPAKEEVKAEAPAKEEAKTEAPAKEEAKAEAPAKEEAKAEAPAKAEAKAEAPAKAEAKAEAPAKVEAKADAPKENTASTLSEKTSTSEAAPAPAKTAAQAQTEPPAQATAQEPALAAVAPSETSSEVTTAPPTEIKNSSSNILGLSLIGAGVVGFGLTSALYFSAQQKKEKAKEFESSETDQEKYNQKLTQANAATNQTLAAAGASVTITCFGIALLMKVLETPKKRASLGSDSQIPKVKWNLDIGPQYVGLSGNF